MHGGRVTGGVSGKTTYLLMGEQLEDGRATTEGSKYKKAVAQPEKTTLLESEYELFGLVKALHQSKHGDSSSAPPQVPAPAPPPAPPVGHPHPPNAPPTHP